MARKRSDLEICIAILEAILEEGGGTGIGAHRSMVQARVYLNWKVFNRHILGLRERGLIASSDLTPTEAGMHFLQRYGIEVRSFLEDFGFLQPSSRVLARGPDLQSGLLVPKRVLRD